jgi:NAD(P)-dependent dehydrogenase (short-subunit alcohol dehydrogenase family)
VAVGAASGTIYYYHYCYIEPTHSLGKRRAKRAPNGARKQVVVLAGSPVEPISRVLAHDLDRRGFIVYWTTSSNEEEVIVKKQGSSDIRCLSIRRSSTDTSAIQESCDKLQQELSKPVVAFQGASPHHLELTGLIIVPDLYYPSGPVESIRPDTWSDLIYSKLLGPIFLLSNGFLELLRNNPSSRVLLLSPTIMGNLNAGFHSAECICSNALYSFALCLHRELLPQGIPLCHIQLGSFDLGNSKRSLQYQERQVFNSIRADILTWPDRLKSLYASSYRASAHLQTARTTSGTNIKNLNHAVYDALTVPNPRRVWTVGQGSVAYRVLNALIPERVMTWLIQPSVLRRDQDWEFIRDDL